ncbi:MAG: glycosyltransferase [Candidatus Omnitrophica bacterium]|nr:glycosyltransferase [Candidatus Omnitrophota bacterium]
MLLAPIVLFAYNRPWHIRQTVEALQKNDLAAESDLIIFSDGPKDEQTRLQVEEVGGYLKTIAGFKRIEIREQKENRGLANSIIAGVTKVVNEYGRVIVLEDDLVTSPFFLRYMNDALTIYRDESKVSSIHGYRFPMKVNLPETYFLRGADCWGWATWKRGWEVFESDGQTLLNELERRNLTRIFDLDGAYPHTQMLRDQINGRNNSWAIRWQAATFLEDLLTLNPGVSLVRNIGLDGSGTHCGIGSSFVGMLADRPIHLERIAVEECRMARWGLVSYYRQKGQSRFARLGERMRGLWKKGCKSI